MPYRFNRSFQLLAPRSLSDSDLSTAANDPRPFASCSARKNPQGIPANTPPVFPGLRPRVWSPLLRLVTKALSDRPLAVRAYCVTGLSPWFFKEPAMNGVSGLQEVQSSTSRSQSYRFLDEQKQQLGTGSWRPSSSASSAIHLYKENVS